LRVYSSHKELLKSIKHKLSVGLVPTMGSLHKGHLSLIEKAYIENDEVIVSIYVNPTQFNDKEDLKKYPRNIKEDLKKLNRFKNVIVYTPENNDLIQKKRKFKTI
jgi:pantoate--beta-alanine ligase